MKELKFLELEMSSIDTSKPNDIKRMFEQIINFMKNPNFDVDYTHSFDDEIEFAKDEIKSASIKDEVLDEIIENICEIRGSKIKEGITPIIEDITDEAEKELGARLICEEKIEEITDEITPDIIEKFIEKNEDYINDLVISKIKNNQVITKAIKNQVKEVIEKDLKGKFNISISLDINKKE